MAFAEALNVARLKISQVRHQLLQRPLPPGDLLQARGVISVQERASYMGQVRDMAKGSCEAWMKTNGWTA